MRSREILNTMLPSFVVAKMLSATHTDPRHAGLLLSDRLFSVRQLSVAAHFSNPAPRPGARKKENPRI